MNPYPSGAISTRRVFDQCWSAAFEALYEAMADQCDSLFNTPTLALNLHP